MAIIKAAPSSPSAAKQCCESTPVVRKRVRRISIDETKNVVYENTQWTHHESRSFWYSPQEFKIMKGETINVARSLITSENELAKTHQDSYANVILKVYQICMDADREKCTTLPKENKKLLKRTIRKSVSRTGLEKLCITDIGQDKRRRRVELTNTVLDVQDDNMDKPADERAELMRVASRKISRASRLFARHMAAASKMED
eukprot:scaffold4093_cov166-Amphora_coffeaeformis.AAC.6